MADRFRIEHEGSSGSELEATDRLDVDEALGADEREALLDRVRTHRQATAERVEKLRVQLARAEDFEGTLRRRLPRSAPASGS
ncbi:hypothetical protein ACFY84_32050 [Streptomyces sp. NPDC012438]|uniref:hypothetical protein n=1 Tax=Streptomyces sp. NPDC012438 TaxID=3364833 RepID=UPI0036F15CE1